MPVFITCDASSILALMRPLLTNIGSYPRGPTCKKKRLDTQAGVRNAAA